MKHTDIAILAFALAFVPCVPALAGDHGHANGQDTAAQDHGVAHDAHASGDSHGARAAAAGFPARRWAPDAPLSQGMQRVRAATTALAHGGHGHLDQAQVRNIADELQSAVEAMFAQCKLDPEPDAALHPLLARVLGAATTLREKGFDAGALASLEQVLADYPRLFDDPAWSEAQSD